MKFLIDFFRCSLLALCLASTAHAQALHKSWEGQWVAAAGSQVRSIAPLSIAPRGAATVLTQSGQACPLGYDGNLTPHEIAAQIEAVRDWQLRPQHWPPGVDPASLHGLIQEFDKALQLVNGLAPSRYRSTRLRSKGDDGCADADDIFFVLHQGQQLLRVRLPSASLGVDVTLFKRQGSP